ncbi:MAG: hypothetical protein ILO36_09290 [Abditibacteriota bacterium]|nr:hypothetical protein [Abditibacteriota bacterium]
MKKDLPMPIVIAVIVVVVVLVAGVYMLLGNRKTPAEIPTLPAPTDGSYVPPAGNGATPAPGLPTPPPQPGN